MFEIIDGNQGQLAPGTQTDGGDSFFEWLVEPQVLHRAAAYAADSAPILIEGETGTGKSELARWIHTRSHRANPAVIRWACGEFDDGTARAALFGHVAGAFTDAKMERSGIFEAANGGTVILDDIDYLSLPLQSALLGVIDNGVVKRIGEAHRERPAQARLIVTTNKNLSAACANQIFLPDLAHRLSFLTLSLPSLHHRPDAVRRLAAHIAGTIGAPGGGTMTLSPKALDAVAHRPLPGNIREIAALVRRACLIARHDRRSEGGVEDIEDRSPPPSPPYPTPARSRGYAPTDALDALRRHNWKIAPAARELGCARQTLYDLINRHGWR